jgi:ABC-type polysaccharide/polyol phosphate export permease
MFLQFGFWLTPIFWSFKQIPEKYHFIFKLNPVYYIVEGYRNSFINHIWIWESPNLAFYFWVETLAIFVIGAMLFRKLKPHFADVI